MSRVPDLAFFCFKGHFVSATNQAELTEVNQVPPCFCGERHLRALANWPAENKDIVPLEPVGSIKVGADQREVDVFNVEKLFAPWFEPDWDIDWDKWEEIPEDLKKVF